MRVLVIEDEAPLREQLRDMLQREGYACDVAADGDEGLFCAMEYPINLAIVDIGLPGKNGIEIIEAVRESGKSYPILILTARDAWQDKVKGLEAGADDYLAKPFHHEELLARLNALLRRSAGHASAKLQYGSLLLDSAAKTVQLSGENVSLTAYEYRVLECLMMNAGKVMSKTALAEHVYDEDMENDSNVIEVFVGRLRKKIQTDDMPAPIETIRGQGYRFRDLDSAATADEV